MKLMLSIIIFYLPFNANLIYASTSDEDTVQLKLYTEKLISNGYNVLNDQTISKEDQLKYSEEFIQNNLHLDWMAKYSLGRNRKFISPEQMTEFVDIYSKFIVKAYADLAKYYKGEQAIIKNVRQVDTNLFIVSTEILKPGDSNPIRVEYLVHKFGESSSTRTYKVGDVITEGVSILNSQQAEFTGVISSNGIDDLIKQLQNKLNNK